MSLKSSSVHPSYSEHHLHQIHWPLDLYAAIMTVMMTIMTITTMTVMMWLIMKVEALSESIFLLVKLWWRSRGFEVDGPKSRGSGPNLKVIEQSLFGTQPEWGCTDWHRECRLRLKEIKINKRIGAKEMISGVELLRELPREFFREMYGGDQIGVGMGYDRNAQ
ncbi:hypothetical protein EV363DRAFT_1296851 [Boletus edulis]|nr:hypothetical protein EV363DRAFT_1296851 [Boletus edulis]